MLKTKVSMDLKPRRSLLLQLGLASFGAIAVWSFLSEQALALVGINFGGSVNPSPTNWTKVTTTGTFSNLIDDSGTPTGVSLTVSGSPTPFSVNTASSSIPSDAPSLSNLRSNFYAFSNGATPATLQLTFSNLLPNTSYGLYTFGLRGGGVSQQTVTITGASTQSFLQTAPADTLAINNQVGNSTRTLQSYVLPVISSSSGTIALNYAGAPSGLYTVAGVAIDPPPPVPVPFAFSPLPGLLAAWGLRNGKRTLKQFATRKA
ncbi:hypothetical protein NC981_19085 [Leptolyngbya sp. DQ-M1]|uniref:hypothetical protein n=1 Tax=Leptolyngbya sp. DQ-M1 TaxID=2933920 RepID=UPI003297D931